MEAVAIRPARIEDAPAIAVVHVRSWQGAYRGLLPQDFLDGLDPAQRVGRWQRAVSAADGTATGTIVADADGEVAGFVSYSPSRDSDVNPGQVGEIQAIHLLPAAWGRGMGRRLMGAALSRLAEAGFRQATLWVLDSNARARRFYEAGGWSADGAQRRDEDRGFPVTQVRYRRPLP